MKLKYITYDKISVTNAVMEHLRNTLQMYTRTVCRMEICRTGKNALKIEFIFYSVKVL